MARGGRNGRRRRRGRRGGGSAQGDGSEPSFVARPLPAHDELTPYLRPGLTPPLFNRAVVASLQEHEVLDAAADEVIAEDIVASAFDALIGKLLASPPGDGPSATAFTPALFD